MTTSELKKVGRLLKETYKKLEQEALKERVDLLSPEYDELITIARQRVLDELGFTLQEYRQAKELVAGVSKEGTLAVMKDTQDKLEDLSKLHIPTTEEIADIAREVAQEFIKPPQITNEIVKETITLQPVKETIIEQIIERVEYDEKPLQEKIGVLSKRLDEIRLPDINKLREELGSDFAKQLEKNINTLDMPNFRKLAMGLQGQIDSIITNGAGVTLSAIGSSPNANGASVTNSILNLEPASILFGGVTTFGTQTFGGAKTFNITNSAGTLATGTPVTSNLTVTGGTVSNGYGFLVTQTGSVGVSVGLYIQTLTGGTKYGVYADITGSRNVLHQTEIRAGAPIRFYDTDSTNYTGLKANGTVTADLDYTLPASAPTVNGMALVSTTVGVMSWVTAENTDDWVDYSATSTIVGWTSFTTKHIRYKISHKKIFVTFYLAGTSNSATTSFTVPTAMTANFVELMLVHRGLDNGVAVIGRYYLDASTTTVVGNVDISGGGWTASGTKIFSGEFFYEIA